MALRRFTDMWNGEEDSGVNRLLAETEILLRWMQLQDENVFDRYQAYGLGKRKLMKLHLESFARESPEVAEHLAENMERLEGGTGGEHGEAFQEVSLDATFSGKTVRQMAHEAGVEDLYRFVYQTASGVTHGEWWAIDDYCMQRCFNPLHRFHSIPSSEANAPATLDFGRYLISRLHEVLLVAEDMLVASEG